MTSASPTITEKPKAKVNNDRPYNVILWNDDVNTIQHVVNVLMQVIGHSLTKATSLAMEVHTQGKSIVKTTHLEYAETYRDALEANGLTATIEQ